MVGRRTHGQVLLDLVLCLSVNIDQTNMDLLLKVAPPVSIRMNPPATLVHINPIRPQLIDPSGRHRFMETIDRPQ